MQWRLGLKARFIGFILVLLTVMFGVITVVLLRTNTASLREDLLARSTAFSALATAPIGNTYLTYQDSGTLMIAQKINRFKDLDPNIKAIAIVNVNGKTVYNSDKITNSVSAEQAESFDPIYLKNEGGVISRIIYPFLEDDGRHRFGVIYDITSEKVDADVAALVRSIITSSVIGLAVSAVVSYLLVNQLFLKPVKRLRDQALVISAGHYSRQISETRKDEIGDLARSVNQMAESLKADILKLTEVDRLKSEFMMIASHNLRTPLTAISGYVDMAKTLVGDNEQLQNMLQTIAANSQRLQAFAEDLLIISSVEAGQKLIQSERITLDTTLAALAKEFKVFADDKKITFETDLQIGDVELMGSKSHLRSAIWNILDNALKFTKESGTIKLEASADDKKLYIKVSDNGIGIAPDEMGKLFTKFHRGTGTLEYNYEGTGVGLYVTKLIVSEHQGTVTVDSTLGKGSTFTISLPVASKD